MLACTSLERRGRTSAISTSGTSSPPIAIINALNAGRPRQLVRYCPSRAPGSRMRTVEQRHRPRARCEADMRRSRTAASVSCRPQWCRPGSARSSGSWKIIRSAALDGVGKSAAAGQSAAGFRRPAASQSAVTFAPRAGAHHASAVIDFPDPLSPTMPSASPHRVKESRCTAVQTASEPAAPADRFSTSKSAQHLSPRRVMSRRPSPMRFRRSPARTGTIPQHTARGGRTSPPCPRRTQPPAWCRAWMPTPRKSERGFHQDSRMPSFGM